MSRITHVELDSFKGQLRRYELGRCTLLTGPNGLGKSAVLEGLRYALSGEVPSGKSLDEVAKYFPPRGGAVLVIDADGNWIRRGITRDHEKAKVSTVDEEEGDADWVANDALLDMRGFLALSPNKRREFVLELVGAGETPKDAEVHAALARDYARQIGGPGADVTLLDGRRQELPEDVALLADRWGAVWSVLSSYLRTGDPTASAIFQRLSDASRERKNAARVAGAEARAAIRELEATAKGAEAAAADLDERRLEAEAAQESLSELRETAAGRQVIQAELSRAGSELGGLATVLEDLDGLVAGLDDPGPRPEVAPAEHKDGDGVRLRREAQEVRVRAEDLRTRLVWLAESERELGLSCSAADTARSELAAVDREPVGQAAAIAARVAGHLASDDCGPSTRQLVGELVDAVEALAAGWRTRRDVAIERLAAVRDAAETAELRHRELTKAAPEKDACDRLAAEERRLLERADMADVEDAAASRAAGKALADWEALVRRQDQVRGELKSARERWQAARVRGDDLSARLAAIPVPDVTAAGERLRAATEALRTAEEAAGALKAYRDAVARAKSEQVSEAAWKAAEAASKRARETYVADVVRPLVDDVAALLAAAGRSERVYLELENDRGKPVFDLGWVSGDSRRSLSALSGGEAVLFCAALAVTIAKRSTGRRVLLIEADPLDEENLAMLLSALSAMDVDLDAVLIATSTEVPSGHKFAEWVDRPARWKVIRFTGDEVVKA